MLTRFTEAYMRHLGGDELTPVKLYQIIFSAANLTLAGETCFLATKTCLIYAFVMQQPFPISYWNLNTCIFVASTLTIFHHTVVSVIVKMPVLPQWDVVVHAMGPIAIASIWAASTTDSINQG